MEIQPLADRVVVRPLEDTEQTRGGLYIPDTAKEKPQQGRIIAVGPGRFEKGARVPMELKQGQKILYGRYSGAEVTLDDQELLIVKESDVLAVIG
ncbi:MAG: molecular chaperone GroES [Gemmatimonas sp. SG8_38_2]|nr:MAG: molecular chaperone GroES [Gemmatimonas sp. SG8_38_2]